MSSAAIVSAPRRIHTSTARGETRGRSAPDRIFTRTPAPTLRAQALTRHVLLPASLPAVLVGARIAAGVAVLVIVASEQIAAADGLGHLIFDSRALFRNDVMFVGTVCVAVLGVVFSEAVRIAGRLLTPWAPRDRGRSQS